MTQDIPNAQRITTNKNTWNGPTFHLIQLNLVW